MAEDFLPIVLPCRKCSRHADATEEVKVSYSEAIKIVHSGVDIAELWCGPETLRVTMSDPFADVLCDVFRSGFQGRDLVGDGDRLNALLASASESVEAPNRRCPRRLTRHHPVRHTERVGDILIYGPVSVRAPGKPNGEP